MDSAKEFDPTIFASGMVRDGSIYLFRDGLKDIKDVEKTLWHNYSIMVYLIIMH